MGNDPTKPDFSNVQSGSATSAPDFSNVKAGSSTTAPAAAQSYTVVAGDTLSKIAKKFLGSANHWHDIYDANRDQISNPDMIQVGQVFKIPAAAGNKS
jgi:nucleoid-associated protein YgaU